MKIEVIVQRRKKGKPITNRPILGFTVINLLKRWNCKLRVRGKLDAISKQFPPSFSEDFVKSEFKGNPDVSIIIGQKQIKRENLCYYVNVSGWKVHFSTIEPIKWKHEYENPITSIFCGALIVGEIFKSVLPTDIKSSQLPSWGYDFVSKTNQTNEANLYPLVKHPPLDLLLVGAGGIGQAIGLGLHQLKPSGKIKVIDPDTIESSNLQRYPLGFVEFVHRNKAELLSRYLLSSSVRLKTYEFPQSYEVAVSINESLIRQEEVFVSTDNKRSRINVQAGMPKIVWNFWTDTAAGTLRYGVTRHQFDDEYECLACVYYPKQDNPSQLELSAKVVGLSEAEVEKKLKADKLIQESDLEYIFKNHVTNPQDQTRLRGLIGMPFHDIFHGRCGVFTAKFDEPHEPTPANHVPILAASYGLIYYFLQSLAPDEFSMKEAIEVDALSYPSKYDWIKKQRNPKCICNEQIYQQVYEEKWHRSIDLLRTSHLTHFLNLKSQTMPTRISVGDKVVFSHRCTTSSSVSRAFLMHVRS